MWDALSGWAKAVIHLLKPTKFSPVTERILSTYWWLANWMIQLYFQVGRIIWYLLGKINLVFPFTKVPTAILTKPALRNYLVWLRYSAEATCSLINSVSNKLSILVISRPSRGGVSTGSATLPQAFPRDLASPEQHSDVTWRTGQHTLENSWLKFSYGPRFPLINVEKR